MSGGAPGPSIPNGTPSAPPAPSTGAIHRGFVKQVLSSDALIIRGVPKGGPPPERQINIAGIIAPRLARRPVEGQTQEGFFRDEPFAWEAREFIREKVVGKEVTFVTHYAIPSSDRVYGAVYLGNSSDGENLAETLLSEGLVELRPGQTKAQESNEYLQKLNEAEIQAKAQKKGRWGAEADGKMGEHIRNITWVVDNPRNLVDSLHQKPQRAVVEHVRDGSTVRAFLRTSADTLDFTYITLMLSGVKAPVIRLGPGGVVEEAEPFAEEAKFFAEVRLLQREVDFILESTSNQNFVGSIIHPKGNIAEFLLKEGYAKCVDWSIALSSAGPEPLRSAEREAKNAKRRIWKNYEASGSGGEGKKNYQAKVIEVVNGDALMIKKDDDTVEKVWLASVRSPRPDEARPKANGFGPPKPLYDVPYMFDAREFLRKRLIGKRVQIHEDYVQPGNENYPARVCCTVNVGGQNVAEALIAKGLGTVVKYGQDNDHRSSKYDQLLAAEAKAEKDKKGVHSVKTKDGKTPVLRIQDLSGDAARSKQFLPFLQRAGRCEGVVEFVASGSRLRVHVPKETCLLTLLLSGINCPRPDRTMRRAGTNIQEFVKGESFGTDAMNFTKERCLQREVQLEVEGMDKAGNFIGYLFVDGENIAEQLVDQGLATVHFTAELSKHYPSLKAAEERAKEGQRNVWKTLGEDLRQEKEERAQAEMADRKIKYRQVVVTDVYKNLRFCVQYVDEGPKLEQMMSEIRTELLNDPPLPGSYNAHRGDICAAKFSVDGQWYRGKVEEVNRNGNTAEILFIDFGNREKVEFRNLATLPPGFHAVIPGAKELSLAVVQWPTDAEYMEMSLNFLRRELSSDEGQLLVNMEYRVGGHEFVTLIRRTESPASSSSTEGTPAPANTDEDIGRLMVETGLALVDMRKEKRLQSLVTDYGVAMATAKTKRLYMWEYGDFTGTEV